MNVAYDLDRYTGAFNFRISTTGIAESLSKVISVNGVASESDLVEYMLGPEPFIRKIPGRGKFTEVEIVRVYAGYDSLYNWRLMIEDGIDDLRMVQVEILAPDLKTVVLKMVLHNCWPHRWQLPNLDASSSSPATETITLACERVTQSLTKRLLLTKSAEGAPRLTEAPQQDFDDSFWGKASKAPKEKASLEGNFWGKESKAPKEKKAINDAFWSGVKRLTAAPEQDFDDSFWYAAPWLDVRMEKQAEALALAAQFAKGDGLDPNEESWDPPAPGDGKNRNAGADAAADKAEATDHGPKSGRGKQAGGGTAGGDGPKGGRGDQAAADYGDPGAGALDPSEESWDRPEAGDGKNRNAGADAAADKAEATNAGPKGGRGAAGEADYGAPGGGPKGGRGAAGEADYGESDGIQDPSTHEFGGSRAYGDPTAANNGGDGTGPIDQLREDFGGSRAADDPTAGDNGGDGTGPVGGRGAQAEADYGEPGSGPVGGRGYYEDGE